MDKTGNKTVNVLFIIVITLLLVAGSLVFISSEAGFSISLSIYGICLLSVTLTVFMRKLYLEIIAILSILYRIYEIIITFAESSSKSIFALILVSLPYLIVLIILFIIYLSKSYQSDKK